MNDNQNLTIQQVYDKEYIPYCIKWGRLTSLVGVVVSFAPLVILAVVFKIMPPLNAILAAATIRISACLVYYFIEPISFQPVLGIPGTYMAFLSGNLSNLRVPCSSVAQKAAGGHAGGRCFFHHRRSRIHCGEPGYPDNRRAAGRPDHQPDPGFLCKRPDLPGTGPLWRHADADGTLHS